MIKNCEEWAVRDVVQLHENAQKYLDSTPVIRDINGTELVDLVLKYYDLLDDRCKKMISLKMVYIPIPKQE